MCHCQEEEKLEKKIKIETLSFTFDKFYQTILCF